MKCARKDIKELLPLYREQALERPERERVETHLETCADCRAEFALLQAMAGEPVPDPGEEFWTQMPSRIYREVRERQSKPPRRGLSILWQNLFLPRWAWAAAVVMIVAALSWLLIRPAQKATTIAVLPADESSYEDVLSADSVDVASLTPAEVENVDTWADREYASITAEAGAVTANGTDTDFYEELAEMDGKTLKRFSTMIDTLGKEGRS